MQAKPKVVALAVIAGAALIMSGDLQAQQKPEQFPNMTFFVTSTGGPNGADFGGIEGADKHCQTLAATAGAGAKTWRAYLSVQGEGSTDPVATNDTPAGQARNRRVVITLLAPGAAP